MNAPNIAKPIRKIIENSFFVACAMVIAVAMPALAQSDEGLPPPSDPAWLDTLNFQMERDQMCEVAFYIRMSESVLGMNTVYEARVQCIDGRQFDATRIGEDTDFDIRLCEIQVC